LVNIIVNEIINYGRVYISSIDISVIINFILSFIEISNLIFFLILMLLIFFLFYFFKQKDLIKFFIVFLLVINFSFFTLIEPITGFNTLLFSKNEANFILSQKIIYREIFLFVFIILSSIFITLSFSCS